jgi:hypothetical protein
VNEAPTAALSGTIQNATANAESDIAAGGSTIIVTLTGDTWVAADGTDGTNANDYLIATADALLDGLAHVSGDDDVADIIAAAKADVTATDNDAVIRTSATVLTITLPAVAGYAIGADEVISLTVPAALMQTTTAPVAAVPNLTIVNAAIGAPPTVIYTLAAVGDSKIYVRFSEEVYSDVGATMAIVAADFTYSAGVISSITRISPISGNGTREAWFHIAPALSADQATSATIAANGATAVYGSSFNAMNVGAHPVTDVGIGVMEPIWASDGIRVDDGAFGGFSPALRDFDGGGELMPSDIDLQARVHTTDTSSAARLHFDANPGSAVLNNGFWLPAAISGLTSIANSNARSLDVSSTQDALKNFVIPSSDSEVVGGNEIEFVLQYGSLYCARSTDAADPRKLAPWKISLRDIVRQRAGVTVLKNVINPEQGEKTVLNVRIETAGTAVIQVFDLKGDIVDILHRGRLNAGEHNFAWDGKNRGGRSVARGMYFIKVVAPGIDETRKVLLVK